MFQPDIFTLLDCVLTESCVGLHKTHKKEEANNTFCLNNVVRFVMDFFSLVSIHESTNFAALFKARGKCVLLRRESLLHLICTSKKRQEELIQVSRLLFKFVLTFGIDILQVNSVSVQTVTRT